MSQSDESSAPLQDYMPTQQRKAVPSNGGSSLNPMDDLPAYMLKFAKEQPQTAALWCFGIGFVAGWKLKPW